MDDVNLAEEISQLEVEIEELGEAVERCRKFILASKIAIAVGGILLVAILLEVINPDRLAIIGTITFLIGGTVAFGANTSTAQQTMVAMRVAEMRRAELISRIDLRLVEDGSGEGEPGAP